VEVQEGTILVFSDIACPWSSLAIFRFYRDRARLGYENDLLLDLKAFPLELFNERPTPKHFMDKEAALIATVEPELGWNPWSKPDARYPGTSMPALEAVQAAKSQSFRASEQLDLKLRQAFWADSRSIYLRSEILKAAEACSEVDAALLADAIDHGTARWEIMEQFREAEKDHVQGSPHFFLRDGSHFHNPGVQMHWDRELKEPIIDKDEPEMITEMIERAIDREKRGG
jgi:predicted DsbA family dithiol-disulfide isomerase